MFERFLVLLCILSQVFSVRQVCSQETSALWNAAKRIKLGLDSAVTAHRSSDVASMPNRLNPPNNPDVSLSSGQSYTISIGVNWANSNDLVISAEAPFPSVQTWAFSTDGGHSWPPSLQSELPPPTISDCFGNPAAFFDANGRAYFVTLGSPAGIYLTGTTDFGAQWSARVNADPLNSTLDDKEHSSADPSGTYPNNLYAAWTDFGVPTAPVQCTRSANNGTTWSARTTLAIGSNRGQGPHIAVGPEGEVYVFWAHYTTGTAEAGIGMAKSTNGGATFSPPAVVFSINGVRISNGGIPALNGNRAASFPYADVDRSAGPRSGWVYVVTPELDVPNTGQADIYLHRSSDGGSSWSNAIRVNGPDVGPGKWQWMPSLAVDPSTGGITVSYYSLDSTGTNYFTNRYAAHSTDGGATWDNWVISDMRFLWPPSPTPTGDYYETAALANKAWATWSDPRTGVMRAWLENIDYTPTTVEPDHSSPTTFALSQNYPNPFNPVTTIRYTLTPSLSQWERVSEGRVRVTLKVYDLLGREVATLVNAVKPPGEYSVRFDASTLPSGVYFYTLRSGSFASTRKMVLIR